jgi:hypothetical protein
MPQDSRQPPAAEAQPPHADAPPLTILHLDNVRLDLQKLNQFLTGTLVLQHDDTTQPVEQIIELAFTKLLDYAVTTDTDDGFGQKPMKVQAVIEANQNQDVVAIGQKIWIQTTRWGGERLPPLTGPIESLAYLLLAVLTSATDPTPRPWPKGP